MHRYPWITGLICLAVIFSTPATNAAASGNPVRADGLQVSAQTRVVTFADLGYATDDTYKGTLATRDYVVRWPDAWLVEAGNKLTILYSHSPSLHRMSSMAVDWNGTRLSSVLLTQENITEGKLEIEIPENLILTGYNRLHIEFFMGLQEDFCVDQDNPAVWATIHKDSFFDFKYENKPADPELSQYPLPLIDNSELVENPITFILPNNPTVAELNAAAVISAKLGQLASWRSIQVSQIEDISFNSINTEGDLIFVGKPDHFDAIKSAGLPILQVVAGNNTLIDGAGNALPSEAGVIWEQVSPADPTAIALFVTGTTDDAVLLAGRALASDASYPRLSGQLGLVLSVPPPKDAVTTEVLSFTLDELGYQDTLAQGTWEQKITYILYINKTWQNGSEAFLDLHFAHSDIISADRSTLTVLVNDTPVGSLALTKANAEDGHASFRIPARLVNVGDNELTIVTNLRLPDGYEDIGDCLEDFSRESWLVVYGDSRLDLPGTPGGLFVTLKDFPSAFIGSASLDDLNFVVPPEITSTIINATIQIAEGLGRDTQADPLFPHVIDTITYKSASVSYPNVIFIGRPTQNDQIALLHDVLPQPFLNGTDQPEPVNDVARLLPQSGSIGLLEAFRNPENYPQIVVSGTTDEGVLWAAGALKNPALRSKLKGDLAILDSPSSLSTAEIRYKSSERFIVASDDEENTEPVGFNIPATTVKPALWLQWVAGGVLVVTLLILIIYALVEIQVRSKKRV